MTPAQNAVRKRMADATRRALELAPGSDREIAELAGVDPSLLSKIRHGESGVSLLTMRRIAGALDDQQDRAERAKQILRRVIAEIE